MVSRWNSEFDGVQGLVLPAPVSGFVDYSSLLACPSEGKILACPGAKIRACLTSPGLLLGSPVSGQSGAPDQNLLLARQALSISQALNKLNRQANSFFQLSPELGTATQGAGAGLGLAGAGLGYAQGQNVPATLSLLNSIGQGASWQGDGP